MTLSNEHQLAPNQLTLKGEMKMGLREFEIMPIIFAVIFSLGILPASAHEGEGVHDEAAEAKELQKSGNRPEIWQEIMEHESHLDQLINAGQLDQVHEAAFTIRDLSKALAQNLAGLSPADSDKVKSAVNEISKVADLLDEYGDAGDKAKTREQFNRLKGLLEQVKKQFPAGLLPDVNHAAVIP